MKLNTSTSVSSYISIISMWLHRSSRDCPVFQSPFRFLQKGQCVSKTHQFIRLRDSCRMSLCFVKWWLFSFIKRRVCTEHCLCAWIIWVDELAQVTYFLKVFVWQSDENMTGCVYATFLQFNDMPSLLGPDKMVPFKNRDTEMLLYKSHRHISLQAPTQHPAEVRYDA